jgi:hypothetical protein
LAWPSPELARLKSGSLSGLAADAWESGLAQQDLQRKKADIKSQIRNGKKPVKDLMEVVNVLYGKAKGTRHNSVPTPTAKIEPGDEAHNRSKFEIQEQAIKLRRRSRFRLLFLNWLRSIKHSHIANTGDQMASAFFGELRGQFLFLLFELVEFHFDEFMMFEHPVQSGEELRTEALFADLQSGLESLSLRLEITDLGVGERKHGLPFEEFSPLILATKF